MNKKDFTTLGKVFEAEVMDQLPFQSKSKFMLVLQSRGLIEEMERVFGKGPFAVKVTGWKLTARGHLHYCQECAKHPEIK